jgi:ABC-type multidrug transport system fused ATPase/permease subunit
MHSIHVKKLYYSYEKTKVFQNNTLVLEVTQSQKNKLYGIIGPSGTGKTTLLSILGGQLKPQKGAVYIDDINIYKVGDKERRNIIAVQMQTATALRGTLRENLVFGIQEDEVLNKDEYLIDVLRRVGLWSLFENKDGLATLIGEGGVNLSGGQRQRLNFAGLYLRAKHYKPSLILIDEPTSSLDEISEQAITQMIDELSQSSITFVVAHRLKTLDQAVGILDTSLISSYPELKFHIKDELMTVSQYYRDLKAGKAQLEE